MVVRSRGGRGTRLVPREARMRFLTKLVVRRDRPRLLAIGADGARGTRTPDLLGAIQALSQLSYSPEWDSVPAAY